MISFHLFSLTLYPLLIIVLLPTYLFTFIEWVSLYVCILYILLAFVQLTTSSKNQNSGIKDVQKLDIKLDIHPFATRSLMPIGHRHQNLLTLNHPVWLAVCEAQQVWFLYSV